MAGKKSSQALQAIQEQIGRDLEPVRPLRSERLCLAASLGLILVASVLLYFIFGPRSDSETLGILRLWGPSIFEILVALAALGLAMGESLPGRTSSSSLLWLIAGTGLTCHVVTYLAVAGEGGVPMPIGSDISVGLRDFAVMMCIGVTILLGAMWIAKRGFTARTGRVGLLTGLGAGLASDAVWRLFCPFSEFGHVFVSHTLAIAVVVVLGWRVGGRWKRRMVEVGSFTRSEIGDGPATL